MIRLLLILFLNCSSVTLSYATNISYQTDTLSFDSTTRFQRTLDKTISSKAYQMTYVGVPLVVGGLIVKSEDDHFRGLRNDYLPLFKNRYDDYLQYLPAAIMFGMKIGGVKSRSSWERMLTSDGFSLLIMGSVVNGLKTGAQVTRPDGSNQHSFPSGHTAMAFMTATMMHKEYGGRSPWYSIGAYSVATATGLTRMANNKHWLSDVLAGAGLGILSTELGYFFADLIFKDKGIHHFPVSTDFDRQNKPSFFGIYLGLNISPGSYQVPDKSCLYFSSGSTAGLEGAWFMNPYIGIGGRFSATGLSVILDDKAQDESCDFIAIHSGTYFSYPVTQRILVGSKILAGYGHYSTSNLSNLSIGGKGGFCMGTGISVTILAKQNLGVRFFLDYNLQPSPMEIDKKLMQTLTLGSAVSIVL